MSTTSYIGVDCGGTHCRIAWETEGRRVDYIGPGGNFTSDPQSCASAIIKAVSCLSEKSEVPFDTLANAVAYLGVAGVQTEVHASRLATLLPFKTPRIEEDRRAFVTGALGARNGFVAAIGTGSFFAQISETAFRTLGGHGLVLGDEASAAWLGREALRWALHAGDGVAEGSALTRALLEELGGAHGMSAFAAEAGAVEFGRLARGVTEAAAQGDVVGRALMHRGAGWISRSVRALGWRAGDRFCMPGTLGAAYLPHLNNDLRAAFVQEEGTALDGALMLARGIA